MLNQIEWTLKMENEHLRDLLKRTLPVLDTSEIGETTELIYEIEKVFLTKSDHPELK